MQDSPKARTRAMFKWKKLDRTTEAYCPNECNVWKVEKAELNANMQMFWIPCQHGPTLQFVSCAKKTAFLEQSWWPEFDMFGSMPWCCSLWDKLFPRLTPKNCYKVYSLNSVYSLNGWSMSLHPCLSPKVIVAGLPRERSSPCLCGHSRHCDSCDQDVFQG